MMTIIFYLLFLQSELVNNLLGSDLITGKSLEPRLTPLDFASNPPVSLVSTHSHGTPGSNLPSAIAKDTNTSTTFNVSYTSGNRSGTSTISSLEIVGTDGTVSISLQPALTIDPHFTQSQNIASVSPHSMTMSFPFENFNQEAAYANDHIILNLENIDYGMLIDEIACSYIFS